MNHGFSISSAVCLLLHAVKQAAGRIGAPVLAATLAFSTALSASDMLRVILIGGQSNADGRAPGSGLPTAPVNLQLPQPNVPFYYYTNGAAANGDGTLGTVTTLRPGATEFPAGGFGPEVKLGYDLSRAFEQQPGSRLVIIKYAKGGSSLHTDWKAGGTATITNDGIFYRTFQRVVTDGLAKLRATYPADTIKLAGMVWVQGETDITSTAANASAYGTNLTNLITDLRLTFNPTLPFFLSRISNQQTAYTANSNYATVRTRQAEVAANVSAAYMIDTDGTAFGMNADNIHFNATGQQSLGAAFATRMKEILVLKASIMPVTGGIQLNWNAVPGKSYQVRKSPDLATWSQPTPGVLSPYFAPFDPEIPSLFFQVAEQ
jgi:lysophospholipase L1-like esterase